MENYEKISEIGTGSFGTVCKIKRKSDGKMLVWKELNYGKMSEKEKQQLVAEVNILRELKHANIVRYYDRIIDKAKTKIYIVMEYCEGGDMAQLIKKCKREKDYIAEDVVWKIFTQIVLALYECHRRKEGKILHRDIKPGNIFLDANHNVKLGDFGLSRILGKESIYAYTHVGTPYYMSPEQINEAKYNEKSDIWSAGCILYEIAALHPPFEATNHLSLAMKIKAGKFERLPLRYSEELQRVCAWMLNVDQANRPSVEDLLNLSVISLRLREKRVKENYAALKKREEESKQKETDFKAKEAEMKEKEKEFDKKDKHIHELEKKVKELQQSLELQQHQQLCQSCGNFIMNLPHQAPYNSVITSLQSSPFVGKPPTMSPMVKGTSIPTSAAKTIDYNTNGTFDNFTQQMLSRQKSADKNSSFDRLHSKDYYNVHQSSFEKLAEFATHFATEGAGSNHNTINNTNQKLRTPQHYPTIDVDAHYSHTEPSSNLSTISNEATPQTLDAKNSKKNKSRPPIKRYSTLDENICHTARRDSQGNMVVPQSSATKDEYTSHYSSNQSNSKPVLEEITSKMHNKYS